MESALDLDHRKLCFRTRSTIPSAWRRLDGDPNEAQQGLYDAKTRHDNVERSLAQDEVILRFECSDMRPHP
jgi:hypothetical protein